MILDSSKKNSAINLRLKGFSYNEISKEISVPKSTLSYWLKKIGVSEKIKSDNIRKTKFIWSKNISRYNKTRAKLYLKNRKNFLNDYANEVSRISDQELWWLGIGLYLGEGEKKEKHKIRFVNSDPAIIIIMMLFFQKCCGISADKFNARIQCYGKQDYQSLLTFWSELTKIDSENFWQPQVVESKHRISKLEYGTLHLTISDSKLNLKIHGWMQGVRFQFMPM